MPYLVDLLRSVAEFGPSYEVPSTSALTSQLIPGIYKEVEEHIGNVKKLFTTTGCTLVMYDVVENSKIVCFNVFAYTPAGFIYIDKIAVPEQGMTSCSLMKTICFMIESLGPENVVQCFFDIGQIMYSLNEYNIFLSVQGMFCRKYPWIFLHENASNRLIVDNKSNSNKEYNDGPGMTQMAIEFFVLRKILEVEKELQALQLPIASESCEGPSREEVVAEIVDKAIHSTEFSSRVRTSLAEDTKMREGLRRLTILYPREEQEALSEQLQLYRMKVPELFSATAMKMLNTIHPRKWWECFGDPCPILQKLAVRIMSQTYSAPLRQLVFQPNNPVDELRMNMLLMEEFGMVKSQINLEPTHLVRISKLPEYTDEYVQKYLVDNKRFYYAQPGLLLMHKPNHIIDEIFGK
ncbi:hypothetical protein LWI29_036289 [Acer saccharum]|uniref:DUF659 domain-containing protein n=1 Tax=Acer saccharum TaxID=4024 RepID=A0AA39VEQ6_ACESA|nr:hypothetical protein LWI29_036289 [Acer saccharum]